MTPTPNTTKLDSSRDELGSLLADLADKHFPKGECAERGRAMVLVAELYIALDQYIQAERTAAQLNILVTIWNRLPNSKGRAVQKLDKEIKRLRAATLKPTEGEKS
jgi:hypothetical protein